MTNNKKLDNEVAKVETTIGELVEIITQLALESGKSEGEGYELASLTLASILNKNVRKPSLTILQ